MKFAIVERERREAQRGLAAECPVCDQAMIARCGEYRVWHWAHRAIRNCDPWWEPETEWHRVWKDHFPKNWQEIICWSKDGEKHIADVKTERGRVVEFQHSHLSRDERESRERFYQKMVWVVNGRRRVRDREHFFALLGNDKIIDPKTRTVCLQFIDNDALLRDWASSRVDVYFDFGGTNELWRLDPRSPNGTAILTPVTKTFFLERCLKGLPPKFFDYATVVERGYAAFEQARAEHAARTFVQQLPRYRRSGFREYLARKARPRRRF